MPPPATSPLDRDASRIEVAATPRRSTNLTLSPHLVAEARELGVNISQAAEAGIEAAVAHARNRRWLAENLEALQSSNTFVEQQGLPLARYRNF